MRQSAPPERAPSQPPAATAPRDEPEHEWGSSWEASRRRRLTAGLAVTPAERIAWLEEMIALAAAFGALPRPRP